MVYLKDYAQIVTEARRGQLVFPTSVNAALQLQQALSDPDCHVEDAIRKVLAEPVLAARAVALANSAVFCRLGGPVVTSARGAVMRVGYRNLYTLAAAMVVRRPAVAALRARGLAVASAGARADAGRSGYGAVRGHHARGGGLLSAGARR
jgi:HD-like signal output (HDOD) protein